MLTFGEVCGPNSEDAVHAVETNRKLGRAERLLWERDVPEHQLVDELLAQEQS